MNIDPQAFLMNVAQVEVAITPRTKAILPVHLYGQTVDMDPLVEIARKHDLRVIEDASQAHGAAYKGKRAGGLGDAAAFSFYFSKNLGAFGDGGMVTTDDPEIAQRVRMLRDHGSPSKYNHEHLGMNARLDELQAVVLAPICPTWRCGTSNADSMPPDMQNYSRARPSKRWSNAPKTSTSITCTPSAHKHSMSCWPG